MPTHAILVVLATFCSGVDNDPSGVIQTVAGTGKQGPAVDGIAAIRATLNNPFDVAYDASGNLYFSDTFNHCVRLINARTQEIATVAGNGTKGFSGDGGPATRAQLNEPYGIVLDRAGNLYIADRLNARVRRVDGKSGLIVTLAGDGSKKYSGDNGPGSRAGLVEPNGVALDPRGERLFIADVADHRIRVIDLSSGVITTFAGDGRGRHAGDGGPAGVASIFGARAVEVGHDGTVYILERQGNTLRSVAPGAGVISTVAGTGAKGFSGDGGPARAATFNGPKELAVDAAGNLFIVDTENHAIRRIDGRSGIITTLAGTGRAGSAGDGRSATSAQLARPHGIAIGPDGSVIIADTENHRLRKVAW